MYVEISSADLHRRSAKFPGGEAAAAASQQFREGMSRLAAAVTIVTTTGTAGDSGVTASAVTSVTDMPPTLLVCLNRIGSVTPLVRENGVFVINVLNASQEAAARAFAKSGRGSGAELFPDEVWSQSPSGPLLAGAQVSFECSVVDLKEFGSHTIFFGSVDRVHISESGGALAYYARAFHGLSGSE